MNANRKATAYGRTIYVAGGYRFDVTAKHAQWLDLLENTLGGAQSTREALAKERDESARLRNAINAARDMLRQARTVDASIVLDAAIAGARRETSRERMDRDDLERNVEGVLP